MSGREAGENPPGYTEAGEDGGYLQSHQKDYVSVCSTVSAGIFSVTNALCFKVLLFGYLLTGIPQE